MPSALPAQQCPNLVWSDEFSGTSLDTSRWTPQIGDGCAESICGWGNNELQWYKAENATVGGGLLTLTAREERVRGKRYTSARLRTLGQGDFVYGRFEARIKIPRGQGMWPAFWMLPTDEVFGGWPASGEIDIMEAIGREPDKFFGTIHYGPSPQQAQNSGASFTLGGGAQAADAFYEVAVERRPNEIRWFVDDVLYSTKTPADLNGNNWPFEERFHLLLNLAVGGNFPGDPDASTVFPQTLEVDYVRVWDASFPHLQGDRQVPHQAAGEVYTVGNAFAGSTFQWAVPAGAAITSGQGTGSITVDWGSAGGEVTVDLSSACGNQQLGIEVEVEPPFFREFSFENFDQPAVANLGTVSGSLVEIANPSPSAVNASALAGEYTRNPAETFDVLYYGTSLADAGAYAGNSKKFSIDLLTSAPVGTTILLQLEDAAVADPTNYPSGRHSRYQAFVEVQDQWHRLTFDYLDAPDPATGDGAVDDLVLLFAPASSSGDVFVFDNFDSYGLGGGPAVPAAPSGLGAAAVSSQQIDLAWSDNSTDEEGFRIERSSGGSAFAEIAVVAADTITYADTGLAPATTYDYRVRAFNPAGDSAASATVSATTEASGEPTSVHVAAIVVSTANAGQGNKRGSATVTLVDDLGQPAGGALVQGAFSGSFAETVTGATDASGTVTLLTNGSKKGSVTLTFCVDSVTAGLPYDPAANLQTCGSL